MGASSKIKLRKPKGKRKPPTRQKPPATLKKSHTNLGREVEKLRRELAEALEQQTATNHILDIISQSPTDVQPVFDAIVESAARLCEARSAVLRLVEGDEHVRRAYWGDMPTAGIIERVPLGRDRDSVVLFSTGSRSTSPTLRSKNSAKRSGRL